MWLRICSLLFLVAGFARAQERRPVLPSVPEAEATFEVDAWFETVSWSREKPNYRPVEGIRVELGVAELIPWTEDLPVLGRAVSDEEGRVHVTLAVPERWREDEHASIWARVVEPGWQRKEAHVLLGHLQKEHPWPLCLRPGGTLLGRAFDDRGRPLDRVALRLFSTTEGNAAQRGSATSDDEGNFALHYGNSGTFDLHARASGVGSLRVRGVALDTQLTGEPIELELLGGVALRGRVLDPAGHPVPGLVITALPGTQLPTAVQRFAAESAGGLCVDRVRTDRAGRFELPSMLPGDYTLHAGYGAEYLGPLIRQDEVGERLGTAVAPSPEQEAESEPWIHGARRLEVEVVNHSGARLDAEQVSEWSEAGVRTLTVVPTPTPRDSRQHEVQPIAVGNLMVYPVEPDREYVVSWSEESVPYCEQRVRVEQHSGRLPVRLTLSAPAPPARLAVRVLGSDGWPFARPCEIVVSSAESGRTVAESNTSLFSCEPLPDATWTSTLPSGRYVIRVNEAHARWSSCGSSAPVARMFQLPTERTLDLRPGEQLSVDLQLGAAGYLDFEPGQDPPPAFDDEAPIFATVTLVSPGGTRVALLEFRVSIDPRFEAEIGDRVAPGLAARGRSLIPAGEWDLRVESDGQLLLEQQITVVAGEVTTIRW